MTTFCVPAEDELRIASEAWMKPLRPCLYTYWPERFKQLSFSTEVIELTKSEVAELSDGFEGDAPWTVALQGKIARGASSFRNGSFFKLESRSPKDNYWGEATNFRACSYHDVRKLLYSERMLDDLVRYSHLESEPLRLLFREWHPIQKYAEFRCFIRRRELAGISQYHYAGWDERRYENRPLAFAKIFGRAKEIESALKAFIADEIIPHLPVDDLVADLWLDHAGKVTLIEINPYGLSDPCLLDYDEMETAVGLFRIVTTEAGEAS